MNAQILHIQDRNKVSIYVSGPEDFSLIEGESISAQIVIENPDISLYCLDDANQRALFAELPPGVDLTQATFYYLDQFEHAQRLIAVPYPELHALARGLAKPTNLILLVNMGRCGSTLLSKALNHVEGVTGYSEPDVYTQIVHLYNADSGREAELVGLLDSCTRLICQPTAVSSSGSPAPQTFAIKFRSTSTMIGDLLYQALPQAAHLFVYRNAIDWVGSYYAISIRDSDVTEAPTEIAQAILKQLFGFSPCLEAFYGDNPPPTLRLEEALAICWPAFLERYADMRQAGVPLSALRYEDLKARPQETLAALFKLCHLPQDQVPNALTAFEQDSQEGSSFAREQADRGNRHPLSAEQIARVRALLARHLTFSDPDMILPGTLQI